MSSVFRRTAALAMAAMLGCVSLTGCGEAAKVDGTKTVLTVNNEEVKLGTASFLARVQQANEYQTQLYYYYMYQQMGYDFGDPSHYFNEAAGDESDKTVGEQLKDSVMENLEKMVVIRQHAEEYGVTLDDAALSEIDRVAQAYIDGNDQEVLDLIGAGKDDVVEALKLLTMQSEMMNPIVKDVDTEVSDELAQQTTVTYVSFENPTAGLNDTESGAESMAESAAESVAASAVVEVEDLASASVESAAESQPESAAEMMAESAAEMMVESGAESMAESFADSLAEDAEQYPDASEDTEAAAEAVLAALLAEEDPAAADVDAVAKSVNDNYYAATGHFTKADPADGTVDSAIAEAVKDLADGQVVDHVVTSSDGTYYYVVRLDHTVDEEQTQTKRDEIIADRKTDAFDETVQGWVDEAEIKVDDSVWKAVAITDEIPVMIKAHAQEADSEAESIASDVSSIAEEVLSAVPEAESVEAGTSAAEEPAE